MTHTENDLRELLSERAAAGDGSPRLDDIVRRGRRIRLRRRAVSTVLAGAAVVSVVAVTAPFAAGAPQVKQVPADSARLESGPKLPKTFRVLLGAVDFTMPLIHSERFTTVGSGKTIKFTPTSYYTGNKVVCSDPRMWVLIREKLKGGKAGGSLRRCSGDGGGHHDERSAPDGWLDGPQSMKVWVFPADAPIYESGPRAKDCAPQAKKCHGKYTFRTLFRSTGVEQLEAEIGERPGSWAIGVYDSPAEPLPKPTYAPPTPEPTDTPTLELTDTPPTPEPTRAMEPESTRTVTAVPEPPRAQDPAPEPPRAEPQPPRAQDPVSEPPRAKPGPKPTRAEPVPAPTRG
ncbi:hypothetical protein [Streptosporangium sp. KLBMP 9127]|nr:hypothetical protein [Streptosporangium sp. KLBMP 9127]